MCRILESLPPFHVALHLSDSSFCTICAIYPKIKICEQHLNSCLLLSTIIHCVYRTKRKAYLSKKFFSFVNITEIYNWKSWHIQGYLFSGCSECKTDVRARAGYIFDIVDILSLAPLLTDLLLVKAIFSLGGTFFAALIQLLIFFFIRKIV